MEDKIKQEEVQLELKTGSGSLLATARKIQNRTVEEIAAIIACEMKGDPNQVVTGINEIHQVKSGDIVFVDHPKYYDKALNSAATIILIDKEVDCPEGKSLIISDAPFDDYNKLTRHFSPYKPQHVNIG